MLIDNQKLISDHLRCNEIRCDHYDLASVSFSLCMCFTGREELVAAACGAVSIHDHLRWFSL